MLSGGDSAIRRKATAWRRGPISTTASGAHRCKTRLQIPILYGIDAVHGHNNVLGAVIFPHNIGLGCTRNPALVEKVGAHHGGGGSRHGNPVDVRAVRDGPAGYPLGPHV